MATTLIQLHMKWKHINYSRKCQYFKHEITRAGLISAVGAVVGMIVHGPKGAIIGALTSGVVSGAYTWLKS